MSTASMANWINNLSKYIDIMCLFNFLYLLLITQRGTVVSAVGPNPYSVIVASLLNKSHMSEILVIKTLFHVTLCASGSGNSKSVRLTCPHPRSRVLTLGRVLIHQRAPTWRQRKHLRPASVARYIYRPVQMFSF